MGWLSRAASSTDAERPAVPAAVADTAPAVPGDPAADVPRGRYGPLVSVTALDDAPPELLWQLPFDGELYRVVPGPDRPDYSLLVLERPVHFYPAPGFDLGRVEAGQVVTDRRGRTMVRVHALLVCSRFQGQQLHAGMRDLAVHLAHVLDSSLATAAVVDLGTVERLGTGLLSEGHTRALADAAAADTSAPGEPARPATDGSPAEADPVDVGTVLDDVARRLHAGVEAHRGQRVQRLVARVTVDAAHRLTGLSGNADGAAPVPTPDTFPALDLALSRLADAGPAGRVASATLRVEGGVVGHEVTATH